MNDIESRLGPFYHSFRKFGLNNLHIAESHAVNQSWKEPVITAYILLAIAKLRNRAVVPITFAELFCADAYYATFARQFGADAACGFDSNRDGHFDRAKEVRALLGTDVELICSDVLEVSEDRRFSIVANVGGLYHVDDPIAALRKSVRLAEEYLIIQNVVSLATTAKDYLERPAPGWNWGNRFSRQSFDEAVRRLGLYVVDSEFNILEGNGRAEDRGSLYYLIDIRRSEYK